MDSKGNFESLNIPSYNYFIEIWKMIRLHIFGMQIFIKSMVSYIICMKKYQSDGYQQLMDYIV